MRGGNTLITTPKADDNMARLVVPRSSKLRPLSIGDELPSLFGKPMNYGHTLSYWHGGKLLARANRCLRTLLARH